LSMDIDAEFSVNGCKYFKVMLFIQHFNRIYNLDIPSCISHICAIFFGDSQTDVFDPNKKGKTIKLIAMNTRCLLTKNGAKTVYGVFNVDIAKYPEILMYRWKFRILRQKENVYIGIDSNPIFYRSDFSNCFRDFKFTNSTKDGKGRDRFCAYGSDGHLYHYYSQIAHNYGDQWKEGDVITMLIDVKREALAFAVNDQYQGIAMDELELSKRTYSLAVGLFYEDDSIELIDFAVL